MMWLIGCVVAFTVWLSACKKSNGYVTWSDMLVALFAGALSWVSVVVMAVCGIVYVIARYGDKKIF